MNQYDEKDYKIFELFRNNWALVTAGDMQHFNSCTVSWGSMGTLWTRPGGGGSVITVYIHPGRYTHGFMLNSDTFTVSFFPKECRKALIDRDMTVTELSQVLGVNRAVLSAVLYGRRVAPEIARDISSYLKVTEPYSVSVS